MQNAVMGNAKRVKQISVFVPTTIRIAKPPACPELVRAIARMAATESQFAVTESVKRVKQIYVLVPTGMTIVQDVWLPVNPGLARATADPRSLFAGMGNVKKERK